MAVKALKAKITGTLSPKDSLQTLRANSQGLVIFFTNLGFPGPETPKKTSKEPKPFHGHPHEVLGIRPPPHGHKLPARTNRVDFPHLLQFAPHKRKVPPWWMNDDES